jgi:hypothetical protein
MKNGIFTYLLIWVFTVFLCLSFQANASGSPKNITLSCSADNDLFIILKENKITCSRYNSPEEAINNAKEGSGVLILANGYPVKTTPINATLYEKARSKKLRLYVEYPSYLPGVEIGSPGGTHWERAVISSDKFPPDLQKLRILAIHDCRLITIKAANSDIVIARVAGFDTAVYGLPKETYPLLTQIPLAQNKGGLLVSTTKLSQFITARYAPTDAWKAIWKYIFTWLIPGDQFPVLKWIPGVRPAFS